MQFGISVEQRNALLCLEKLGNHQDLSRECVIISVKS